jgi:hypothetical protein
MVFQGGDDGRGHRAACVKIPGLLLTCALCHQQPQPKTWPAGIGFGFPWGEQWAAAPLYTAAGKFSCDNRTRNDNEKYGTWLLAGWSHSPFSSGNDQRDGVRGTGPGALRKNVVNSPIAMCECFYYLTRQVPRTCFTFCLGWKLT